MKLRRLLTPSMTLRCARRVSPVETLLGFLPNCNNAQQCCIWRVECCKYRVSVHAQVEQYALQPLEILSLRQVCSCAPCCYVEACMPAQAAPQPDA